MNKPLVLLIPLLLLTINLSAQAPGEISFYLKSRDISNFAKDFYNMKFQADDGTKTLSILDSIRTKNDVTRPFYFYLVSKMMNNSDGALSEALGNTTKEFLEEHPDQLINFLYSSSPLVTKQLKSNWAKAIAGEFMIICEDKKKECINSSLQKTTTKISSKNRYRLTQFYNLIIKY